MGMSGHTPTVHSSTAIIVGPQRAREPPIHVAYLLGSYPWGPDLGHDPSSAPLITRAKSDWTGVLQEVQVGALLFCHLHPRGLIWCNLGLHSLGSREFY